jgi:hypothetical protein
MYLNNELEALLLFYDVHYLCVSISRLTHPTLSYLGPLIKLLKYKILIYTTKTIEHINDTLT